MKTLTLMDAADVASLNGGGLLDISPETLKNFRETARNLHRFLGCNPAVSDITPQSILDWQTWQLESVTATSTNDRLRTLRGIYGRLVKRGLVNDNPAAYVAYVPEERHIPEAISLETYQRLRAVGNARDLAFLGLLWGTGCRIGEIPTMRTDKLTIWEDADEPGRLRLSVMVKGKYHRRLAVKKATRYVYCDGREAEDVQNWLDERPIQSTYLFTDKGGLRPIGVSQLHSMIRLLRRNAGIDPHETVANAHSFRHCFVYRKQREGYPIEWISQWLGHSDPMFTAAMYGDKTERENERRFFAPPPGVNGRP